MTKQQLISEFVQNHIEFNNYINALTEVEFAYSNQGKWTAGQQLEHVYLCLYPISQALASKEFILHKFGKTDRSSLSYDEIIDNYKAALAQGGKAPDRFVPGAFDPADKSKVSSQLLELLETIAQQLDGYTNEELDSLLLPHPLLGNLTITEMFYLMTYHATHHHRQTELNLHNL